MQLPLGARSSQREGFPVRVCWPWRVGTGLRVLAAMMEADVTTACGPKGRHDPVRTATRHGHEAGSVSLGGRRVPVARPRMRATDSSGELAVPIYELFSGTEVLGQTAAC
jgi:putative transposase